MKPEDLFQFVVVGVVITMVLAMLVLLFCKDEHDDAEATRKQERWRAERADKLEAKRDRERLRELEREKPSEPPAPQA